MNRETPQYGRTESPQTRLLESVELDFSDGESPGPNLGRTGTPINIFADWFLDGTEPAAAPTLVLTFRLRPGANPSAVTFDLFAAFAGLNRYEISLGGRGLVPDEARSDLAPTGDMLRLALTATEPAGSVDRLAQLAAVVNGREASTISGTFVTRSFGSCEAALHAAA